MIVVTNEEGRYRSVNPTDEEREATAAKILEVGHWWILPGETFYGTPGNPKALLIRSQSGEANFVLQVIPR